LGHSFLQRPGKGPNLDLIGNKKVGYITWKRVTTVLDSQKGPLAFENPWETTFMGDWGIKGKSVRPLCRVNEVNSSFLFLLSRGDRGDKTKIGGDKTKVRPLMDGSSITHEGETSSRV